MTDRRVLIVGYGNSLRQDDGVGRLAAEAAGQRLGEEVRSLSVPQLTPELAAEIAQASAALFVDAIPSDSPAIIVQPLQPGGMDLDLGHRSDPGALLALTQAIYGVLPPAWWILIPGSNFGFGEGLSPLAESCLLLALEEIERLVRTLKTQPSN